MAATVTILKRGKTINRKITIASILMDNSYTTGGLAVTPAQLGLNSVDIILFESANGYTPQFDYTNNKVKFYTSAGTETSNATDLSAITLRVKAIGQ